MNGPSETKPNPENCKNCSYKCVHDFMTVEDIYSNTVIQHFITREYGVLMFSVASVSVCLSICLQCSNL